MSNLGVFAIPQNKGTDKPCRFGVLLTCTDKIEYIAYG